MTFTRRVTGNDESVKTVEAIKSDWRWGPFIGFFLAFLAATVFADTSPVKTESQQNRTPTPAVLQSPASKQGLNFVVGAHGLDSLSFNGQSLLVSPESGELQPQKSVFRAVLDALLPRSSPPVATPDKNSRHSRSKLSLGTHLLRVRQTRR